MGILGDPVSPIAIERSLLVSSAASALEPQKPGEGSDRDNPERPQADER